MTNIQVQYWQLQEAKQHNRATESQARNELDETKRHNLVFEGETQRHNMVTEGETNRHNLVTEDISQASLEENIRHNKQSEAIGWQEAETHRMTAISNAELNKLKGDLTRTQIDNYDLELLSKMGKAGQLEALVAKNVNPYDNPIVKSLKSYFNNPEGAVKIMKQLGVQKTYGYTDEQLRSGGIWYE